MSRAPERRARGQLERQVLACLAGAERPLTPSEVLQSIGGGLAYTTVMTTLTRLFEKGALQREAVGRAYAYSLAADPTVLQSVLVAQRMRRVLDAGKDRAGVLTRFVADLTPEDERLLADLLGDVRPDESPGHTEAGPA
jgi:predicted transcriptional regulator